MKRKSGILQILHGERGSYEVMPERKTKEYYKWANEQNRLYDELKKALAPKFIKTINEMVDAINCMYLEVLDRYYLEGFKLGLLVGMETVSNYEYESAI